MNKLLLLVILLSGCERESPMRDIKIIPGVHNVKCYSGSKQIWAGRSKYTPNVYEGKVSFKDLAGRELTITGECVITTYIYIPDTYE